MDLKKYTKSFLIRMKSRRFLVKFSTDDLKTLHLEIIRELEKRSKKNGN